MGRLLTYDIKLFTEKHHVSVDWLICGDLKGLLRTVQGCPSRPRQDIVREETTRQEFRRLLLQLKPDQLPALVEILRRQFDNDGDVA